MSVDQGDECGSLADFNCPTLAVNYSFSNFSFKVSSASPRYYPWSSGNFRYTWKRNFYIFLFSLSIWAEYTCVLCDISSYGFENLAYLLFWCAGRWFSILLIFNISEEFLYSLPAFINLYCTWQEWNVLFSFLAFSLNYWTFDKCFLCYQNLSQLASINFDLVVKNTKELPEASKSSIPWPFTWLLNLQSFWFYQSGIKSSVAFCLAFITFHGTSPYLIFEGGKSSTLKVQGKSHLIW